MDIATLTNALNSLNNLEELVILNISCFNDL